MYTPPHNRNADPAELLEFMRRHSFVTLVTSAGGLAASHIPVSVEPSGDGFLISGHLSKANSQWRELPLAEVMVVFTEPHAYISPANYPPGLAVPTWNYIAVHAYGAARLIETREETLAILRKTIAGSEPGYLRDLESYPAEWVDAKLKGIVAFELQTTRIESRWKLSQEKDGDTRERIAASLEAADPAARELAGYMRANQPEGAHA